MTYRELYKKHPLTFGWGIPIAAGLALAVAAAPFIGWYAAPAAVLVTAWLSNLTH